MCIPHTSKCSKCSCWRRPKAWDSLELDLQTAAGDLPLLLLCVCVGGGVRWLTNACNSSYRDPMPSTHTRVCILTQRHTHIYTISTEISKSFFFLKVLRNEDCVAAIPLLVMTDQHTAISKLRKVSKVEQCGH